MQMEAMSYFNFFDVFLISVIAISAIIGFSRGFIREVLGTAAWIGALFLASKGFEWPETFLRSFIQDETISYISSRILVFCVFLILFILIAQLISYYVQNSIAQSIDRSLGIIFGILRGCVLICIFYFGTLFFISKNEEPSIVKTSLSLPWIQKGVKLIQGILPKKLKEEMELSEKKNQKPGFDTLFLE